MGTPSLQQVRLECHSLAFVAVRGCTVAQILQREPHVLLHQHSKSASLDSVANTGICIWVLFVFQVQKVLNDKVFYTLKSVLFIDVGNIIDECGQLAVDGLGVAVSVFYRLLEAADSDCEHLGFCFFLRNLHLEGAKTQLADTQRCDSVRADNTHPRAFLAHSSHSLTHSLTHTTSHTPVTQARDSEQLRTT